jgi:hypothetical protein
VDNYQDQLFSSKYVQIFQAWPYPSPKTWKNDNFRRNLRSRCAESRRNWCTLTSTNFQTQNMIKYPPYAWSRTVIQNFSRMLQIPNLRTFGKYFTKLRYCFTKLCISSPTFDILQTLHFFTKLQIFLPSIRCRKKASEDANLVCEMHKA